MWDGEFFWVWQGPNCTNNFPTVYKAWVSNLVKIGKEWPDKYTKAMAVAMELVFVPEKKHTLGGVFPFGFWFQPWLRCLNKNSEKYQDKNYKIRL
jgi:hypothetical protein